MTGSGALGEVPDGAAALLCRLIQPWMWAADHRSECLRGEQKEVGIQRLPLNPDSTLPCRALCPCDVITSRVGLAAPLYTEEETEPQWR